jgi:molecular chaperone DnaK
MSRIIGIDLGTTNTAVAVMEGGRPRVIEDERGYKVLPSVISAKGDGKFVVGQAAHNLILTRPERTVYATKRLIGRRFDSPEVQEAIRRVNFKVRAAPDGGVEMQVGDQWMSPTEVAAVVLQVARSIAEKALGEKISEAVVTVPAYFNHAQRKATIEAAEMAGLRCDRLLHEPTAAALAFGHRKNVERTILIFDLGGGTFDVSVLKLSSGIYETLSTLGDSYLGGEDMDSRIVDHVIAVFKKQSGVDLTPDKNAVQRVREAAERAKCELSFADRTSIVIPHVTPQHSIEQVLTRATLEDLTRDLVVRCIDITRRAVQEGGLKVDAIDEVILVGGQTRMPLIRESITGLLGREPSRTVHPEEAVAVGAAVHAANLSDGDQSRTVLLDVTPFDLGIDSAGGVFVPIVHRNSRVPSSETRVFATASDNQESVRVTVRQGESRNASENEFLGEFVLTGLSPAPRMQTKVDVTFRIDGNGMLHVLAMEKGSGERKNITIRNYAEHAASPRMPTPEEAKAAAAERERKAVTPKVVIDKKPGVLSGLFGVLGRGKKAAAPVAAGAPPKTIPPTTAAPNTIPPTTAAPTTIPPTSVASTSIPPTAAAPTTIPPTAVGPMTIPPNAMSTFTPDAVASAPEVEVAPLSWDTPPGAILSSADASDAAESDAAIILPELTLPDLLAVDEVFALEEGDDEAPYEGFAEVGAESDASVGVRDDDARTVAESAGATLADYALLEPALSQLADNPFEVAQDGLTEASDLQWGGSEVGGTDAEGNFDFRLSESETAGGFTLPDEDTGEVSPESDAELAAALAAFQADDRTPNEDDTAVMRRAWAWADEAVPAAKDAKAVDLGPDPFVRPAMEPAAPTGRKPARVRLRYPDTARLGEEYRENLRKGGTFVKTAKPLAVGRECICEVSAPGLEDTLLFPAVVTFVATSAPGQDAGMGIEYRLSDAERRSVERIIDRL